MNDTVLKGGVSYNKYIWHASSNACDACQGLDGNEYEYDGNIPDHPHPNCQCYIEVVENDENEEPCDCIEQIQEWLDECEEACGDTESLIDETEESQNILEDYLDYISNYSNPTIEELASELYQLIENSVTELIDAIEQTIATIQIFHSNLEDLKAVSHELGYYLDGSAEYFHTKANCEATQLGKVGEQVATILGYIRELGDFPKEILFKGQSIKDAFEHSIHDLEINEQGRKLGRENPDKNPEDIIIIPEGLPEKYW